MKILLAAVTLAVIAGPASAAVLDSFDRADAASLGSGWTQVEGTSSIAGNAAIGTDLALATFNGGSGDVVSFDLKIGSGTTQYGAAVLGYGGGSNYFVKVQSNSGGSFDNYAFYDGNNGGGLFNTLSASFSAATIVVSRSGSVLTLDITPDVGAAQQYIYDYGFVASGTGIGLGFYGNASIDNFGNGVVLGAAVPEPMTWALLVAGFGLTGAALRRRRQGTVAA